MRVLKSVDAGSEVSEIFGAQVCLFLHDKDSLLADCRAVNLHLNLVAPRTGDLHTCNVD